MSWMNEYPRPQLRRDSFFCLNGTWQMNGRQVEVPYPPQSRLSGWKGEVPEEMTYVRSFELPEGFVRNSERVRLHFGAVDQVCEVFVNGKPVVRHEGGYLPFFADVTDVLRPGANELKVCATDTLSHDYPYGKQRKNRGGMWYTPVSGIWQTVWMEAVPDNLIESLKIVPDRTGIELTVRSKAKTCRVFVPDAVSREIETNRPVRIDIGNPRLWSPDDPHLYDLFVETEDDRVESYFALRTVEIGDVGGKPGILLNGKPVFLNGVLDQGYFEDGIFLPETPEGFYEDVRRMKDLGINLLRKHIKVEPETFYYACDRLGMPVMQDMVNNGNYSFLRDTALPTLFMKRKVDEICIGGKRRREIFTQHSLDTVAHLCNHPSIIAYTIFNEGWGQFRADENYEILKKADPTRILDATSGWFFRKKSDLDSHHVYFRNVRLKGGRRPVFLSECGGFARPIKGHMFNPEKQYGYTTVDSEEALMEKIEKMWNEMVLPSVSEGLCGVVYTQVSDVEDEINGLYTYDREICKVSAERMRALAEKGQKKLESRGKI